MRFGFSYVGLIYLIMLIVPSGRSTGKLSCTHICGSESTLMDKVGIMAGSLLCVYDTL